MELHAAFESLKIGQTCSRPMILVMLAISALPGQGDEKTASNSYHFSDRLRKKTRPRTHGLSEGCIAYLRFKYAMV